MPKIATVVADSAKGPFTVRRAADDTAAFDGTLTAPVQDPDSGDAVRAADFSALTTPGRYYLDVPGAGRSAAFDVRADVYARPLYLAARSFYGQRCGTAVDLGPAFPGYRYDACHLTGAYHPSSGRTGPRASTRGWHDAGDYGRYVVNSGITTGTLLWTWEIYGDRLKDLSLDLPESRNAVPDLLDEIRWNLDWMLTMQDEDGGVWHKQTSERFPGFVMPHADDTVSVVVGTGSEPFKGTCATADFAAVMAIAARVYRPFDEAFAGTALDAATRAWTWTARHPSVTFRNPPGVATGAYGDGRCDDERFWAAAELWRTTKGAPFAAYVAEHHNAQLSAIAPAEPPSWARVGALGLWTLALAGGPDADTAAAIRRASLEAADTIAARTSAHGHRVSLTTADYVWGSNGVAANYGLQLLVAHALRPDAKYLHAALDNLHYLLGRNAFALSWVTGVGERAFRHPHHRPSGADGLDAPWPGLLSGGPNRRRQDPAMRELPDLPPAKMYVDDQESYASNENAINWNAPLVFLLAGVQPPR